MNREEFITRQIEKALRDYKNAITDYAKGIAFGTLIGIQATATAIGDKELYNKVDIELTKIIEEDDKKIEGLRKLIK